MLSGLHHGRRGIAVVTDIRIVAFPEAGIKFIRAADGSMVSIIDGDDCGTYPVAEIDVADFAWKLLDLCGVTR